MVNDRDPRSDLGAWLGEELRRARLAAGFKSQDQLARKLGFERTVITKIETGDRPPSSDVAEALLTIFPELAGGKFAELAAVARRASGRFPGWFERDWLPVERAATSLRWWEPILIPGLLQTGDYAPALFQSWQPTSSEDELIALVDGRFEHQSTLDRDNPSYSGGNGGARVEVADKDGMILVRDTEDHGHGPVYMLGARRVGRGCVPF